MVATPPMDSPQQRAEYAARLREALQALPSLAWLAQTRDAARVMRPALVGGLYGSAWGQPREATRAYGTVEKQIGRAVDVLHAAVARANEHLARVAGGGVDASALAWAGPPPGEVPSKPRSTLAEMSRFVTRCRGVLQPAALTEATRKVHEGRSRVAAAVGHERAAEMDPVLGMLAQAERALSTAAAEAESADRALGEYLGGALGTETLAMPTTGGPRPSTPDTSRTPDQRESHQAPESTRDTAPDDDEDRDDRDAQERRERIERRERHQHERAKREAEELRRMIEEDLA